MQRSERVVTTLMEVDPGFQQLVEVLYGPTVDAAEVYQDVFAKRARQLSPEEKRARTEQRIAQASNVVGLAAGTAGTASAYSQYKDKKRIAQGKPEPTPKPKGRLVRAAQASRVGRWAQTPKGAATMAGAGLALQAGNVAGDAITARVLGRSGKKVEKRYYVQVEKGVPLKEQAKGVYASMKRMLVPTNGNAAEQLGKFGANMRDKPLQTLTKTPAGAGITAGTLTYGGTRPGKRRAENKAFQEGYYAKRDTVQKAVPDLELAGTFSKFDDEKRQAFGYASVVKKNGLPVIDRQGDYIDLTEMEKAAYHYVQKSRVGGDMHRRQRDEYGIDKAHHVSDLIESVVFTEEKCKAMGLPDEVAKQLEGHWWVGYQIHDEDTWQEVRKKGRTGFSIHGRGKRVDTSIDELV